MNEQINSAGPAKNNSITIQRRRHPFTPDEIKKLNYDLEVLEAFTKVYCRKRHKKPKNELCAECSQFLDYAKNKRSKCPLDPKPKCKDCPVHCYSAKMRQTAKEVMRAGGIHFILRGRIDWAVKYAFFSRNVGPNG
jgi:hypothetical protein